MASLPDSFFANLNELSNNEAYPEEEDADTRSMEEDGDGMPCCEFKYNDLNNASKLHKTNVITALCKHNVNYDD
uniref:Uncharacterized protein n=1 Tax=Oryza brachyantha TaxID=4533 RepID=J3LGQ6_ORYBR